MTLDLAVLLEEWQGVLRLRDWDLSIRYAHAHELEDLAVSADIDFTEEHREARIRVLFPDEAPSTATPPYDAERSVVHELLHLTLEYWEAEPRSLAGQLKERAINTLATALLGMKYAPKEKPA